MLELSKVYLNKESNQTFLIFSQPSLRMHMLDLAFMAYTVKVEAIDNQFQLQKKRGKTYHLQPFTMCHLISCPVAFMTKCSESLGNWADKIRF